MKKYGMVIASMLMPFVLKGMDEAAKLKLQEDIGFLQKIWKDIQIKKLKHDLVLLESDIQEIKEKCKGPSSNIIGPIMMQIGISKVIQERKNRNPHFIPYHIPQYAVPKFPKLLPMHWDELKKALGKAPEKVAKSKAIKERLEKEFGICL